MVESGRSSAIDVDPARLAFIGGLHRSGTTPLGRVLASHDDVSGFAGTGAIEDEGQHLQDVYRPANRFGGSGRFARADDAHLGAVPEPEATELRRRLLEAWTPHWDLERRVLVEKSPPNLIMGRYLQSVFPGSALVVIIRHPVVVALSTKKWTRTTGLRQLVEHWFIAHERLRSDAADLERLHVIRYEDLITDPASVLSGVGRFLGLDPAPEATLIQRSRSDVYLDMWAKMRDGNAIQRARRRRIESSFAEQAAEYGYDISDLTALAPWQPITGACSP